VYPVPVVKGYIAKAGDLESSTKDVQVTPDTIKDINETVYSYHQSKYCSKVN